MGPRLVERLVDAGLVTPTQADQLPEERGSAGGDVARSLIEQGLEEDALAGFFVARGFGPVLDYDALARGDAHLRRRLGVDNARRWIALPLRSSPAGVIVAMADPTDDEAIAALKQVFEQEVLPTVARLSDLVRAIDAAFPETAEAQGSIPQGTSKPVELIRERHPSGMLHLTRAKEPKQAQPEELVSTASAVWDQAWSQSLARARETSSSPPSASSSSSAPTRTETAPPAESAVPFELSKEAHTVPTSVPSARVPSVSVSVPSVPVPLTDYSDVLDRIDQAQSRDDVIRAACEGCTKTAQGGAFLALRKGVLRGWYGCGEGVAEGSIQSLWVPASNPSMLSDVLQTQEPTHGPYGTTAADHLFRAAMGGQGKGVAVAPVFIGERVCGLLCAADPADGVTTVARLADAVGEGFKRLIVAKRG